MSQQGPPNEQITITTIRGAKSKQPLVVIKMGKESRTIDVDAARDLAINLLEASEASIMDHLVIKFFEDVVEDDEQMAAMMMMKFREFRRTFEMGRGRRGSKNTFPKDKDL